MNLENYEVSVLDTSTVDGCTAYLVEYPPNYIYIVNAAGTDNYKIGKTINVDKRISELQTGCPQKIIVVCAQTAILKAFDGSLYDVIPLVEAELHRTHKQYKCSGGREWFTFDADYATVLKSIVSFTLLDMFWRFGDSVLIEFYNGDRVTQILEAPTVSS